MVQLMAAGHTQPSGLLTPAYRRLNAGKQRFICSRNVQILRTGVTAYAMKTEDGHDISEAAPKQYSVQQLSSEVTSWQLLYKAKETFPKIPWGPQQLVQVLGVGITGLAIAGGISSQPQLRDTFTQLLTNSPADALLHLDQSSPDQAQALTHVAREGSLLIATVTCLTISLVSCQPRSQGLFKYNLGPGWTTTTLLLCCFAFPLADPVLSETSRSVLNNLGVATQEGGHGGLADAVRDCVAHEDWASLGLHTLASGLIGPLWEETFWRGFFLASLTKVLPYPACIALSSTWFAMLHLNPANFASIWLLAVISDMLALRSASLGPPLLLHAAWNTTQLLAVAFLGKDAFV